jgi:hypothetical protein
MGRLASPDPRDAAHLMAAVLPPAPAAAAPPPSRYWPFLHPPLDQGATASCVAHAWTALLLGHPLPVYPRRLPFGPLELYRECQRADEWPGEEPDYFGTSVRAGARVLRDRGYVGRYVWARTVDEVRRWVGLTSGVVVGVDMHQRMVRPEGGVMRAEGPAVGGHAMYVLGYSDAREAFRVLNSWGAAWAENGRAWLPYADLARLLDAGGEACTPSEVSG